MPDSVKDVLYGGLTVAVGLLMFSMLSSAGVTGVASNVAARIRTALPGA